MVSYIIDKNGTPNKEALIFSDENPQSFDFCDMGCNLEEYQNNENYGSFNHQEQNMRQFDLSNCNHFSSAPVNENKQGYYDSFKDQYCNDRECVPQSNQDDLCFSCESAGSGDTFDRHCPEGCQLPMCSPFKKRRYVQPPRRQSFRPMTFYKKPDIPMSNETIYRKSFEGVDSSTALCCRPPPFNPDGFLRVPGGPFEKETVTKMSFQRICGAERRLPIKPKATNLLGKGPMQALTTQKHDFVPKYQSRRQRVVPRDNISKSCGCMEKCTVQKLSFMPPCGVTRTKSFKPTFYYKQPDLPMEFETTQKLSYMPVCPKPKENMPWAIKASYMPPTLPFAKDTVTKLSYQPPGCFQDEECCCEPCEMPC